jgi:hypothetical protein
LASSRIKLGIGLKRKALACERATGWCGEKTINCRQLGRAKLPRIGTRQAFPHGRLYNRHRLRNHWLHDIDNLFSAFLVLRIDDLRDGCLFFFGQGCDILFRCAGRRHDLFVGQTGKDVHYRRQHLFEHAVHNLGISTIG